MSSRKRPSGLKDSPKTKKARTEEAGTSKSAEAGHAADIDPETVMSEYLRCLAKPTSNVLSPHKIQFSGKFYGGEQQEMHDLVKAHGATLGKKKVFDLLVATLDEYEGHTNKFVQEALKKHIPVVHETYLYDAILKGSRHEISYYSFRNYKASSENSDGEDEEEVTKPTTKGHAADINPKTVKSKYLRCLAKPTSHVLWPHMIQFSGKFCGKQQEMHDLVKAHDAKIGSKKVFNLLVATLQEYEGQTNKVAQALKKHVSVVHEMFLYDAILNGSQPDMAYYNFSYYKASSGTGNSDVEDVEESGEEDTDSEFEVVAMRDINPALSKAQFEKAAKKPKSNVLKGHKITFSGKFSISQKQIQELALTHGAQLGSKTKFSLLIASPDGYDYENAKVLQAEILMVPIVHELFLYDAIINGKVPKTKKYDLSQA